MRRDLVYLSAIALIALVWRSWPTETPPVIQVVTLPPPTPASLPVLGAYVASTPRDPYTSRALRRITTELSIESDDAELVQDGVAVHYPEVHR